MNKSCILKQFPDQTVNQNVKIHFLEVAVPWFIRAEMDLLPAAVCWWLLPCCGKWGSSWDFHCCVSRRPCFLVQVHISRILLTHRRWLSSLDFWQLNNLKAIYLHFQECSGKSLHNHLQLIYCGVGADSLAVPLTCLISLKIPEES